MATPRAVRAALADVDPVPPLATASVPVVAVIAMVPPELLAAWAWFALAHAVAPIVGLVVHPGMPDATSKSALLDPIPKRLI
jgi:hypothetical protein